jgi:hypothetical protein
MKRSAPVNQWDDFGEFKEFLKSLQNLNIVDVLKREIQCSQMFGRLNFYYPFPIEQNFLVWFIGQYNMQQIRFSQTVGSILRDSESVALCNRISNSQYAALFFGDSWEQVVPSFLGPQNPQLSMSRLLNPALLGSRDTENDKTLMALSALKSPSVNEVLQKKLPKLFPDGLTMAQLVSHNALWGDLCAGLVVFVEREHLKRKETFNIGDLRSYIESSSAELRNRLPIMDVLRHEPRTDEGTRFADWKREVAERVFNKATLLAMIGKPAELSERYSSPEETDAWVVTLLEMAEESPAVRQQLCNMTCLDEKCIFEAIANIGNDLFPRKPITPEQLKFSGSTLAATLQAQGIPSEMIDALLEAEVNTLERFLGINDSDLKLLFPNARLGAIIELRTVQNKLKK